MKASVNSPEQGIIHIPITGASGAAIGRGQLPIVQAWNEGGNGWSESHAEFVYLKCISIKEKTMHVHDVLLV